jgi:hypothetical protein
MTMTSSRRPSASGFLAAVLAGLAGFMAFNVIDTVFRGRTPAEGWY